ncbi:helix-turn-helix domain-containing protein [Peterkaempfera sp. SMS 1(5)a]|uniref:helix-turn-helix domain-containing protein n=1 Tax=Peterkaempfera podocarpi TaxID=3232308 RepID=UPI003670C195
MAPRPTVEVDGAAIRRIRLLSGMEMGDLAGKAGITPNYLCRIETGSRRNLGPRVYAAIRTHLGATDDQLLAPGEDQQQRTT